MLAAAPGATPARRKARMPATGLNPRRCPTDFGEITPAFAYTRAPADRAAEFEGEQSTKSSEKPKSLRIFTYATFNLSGQSISGFPPPCPGRFKPPCAEAPSSWSREAGIPSAFPTHFSRRLRPSRRRPKVSRPACARPQELPRRACRARCTPDSVRPLKRMSDSHAVLIRSGRWIAQVIERPAPLPQSVAFSYKRVLVIYSLVGKAGRQRSDSPTCLPPPVLRHICKGRPNPIWHSARTALGSKNFTRRQTAAVETFVAYRL